MNAYYENKGRFNSNSRTFEGYFTETKQSANLLRDAAKKLLAYLTLLLRVLTDSRVCRIAKAVSVAVSLVGFVGVIGAIEHGNLGMGTGLLIGASLLGLEYLCLRGRRQASRD